MRFAYIQISKYLYISNLKNQHWTKSNDCLLTLVNRRFSLLASLVAPETLRTASLQYIRHPAPKMHITNVHHPKKMYICKMAQSSRFPLVFIVRKRKFTYFNTRKNCPKKTLRSFFSVSLFPLPKCAFSAHFKACNSLKFSFFVRIVFVEVLCKKTFLCLQLTEKQIIINAKTQPKILILLKSEGVKYSFY